MNLTAFLRAGFRAREICCGRALSTEPSPGASTTRGGEPDAQIKAADFAATLKNAGVTQAEAACLWARYALEGRPGETRSQATAEDMAKWLERVFPELGRFTARAVKVCIKHAEIKLVAYRR